MKYFLNIKAFKEFKVHFKYTAIKNLKIENNNL